MTDRDDRAARAYRAASDTLDERPAAMTRAAILAAAARQVQSVPQDARTRLGQQRSGAWRRWPYAAAAAVLLSTLAVMLASRTGQEMPSFSPEAERVTEALPPGRQQAPERAEPSADSSAASQPTSSVPITKITPATPAAPASRRPTEAPQADVAARRREGPPSAKEEKAAATAPAEPAAAEVAPAPAPQPLAKQAARANDPSESRNEVGSMQSAERAAVPTAPAARPAAAGALGGTRSEADATAAHAAGPWLERIVQLRRAGQHEAADLELKRFRERYPQWVVPPEALPPAAPLGTR
jgi:hypothetical protein